MDRERLVITVLVIVTVSTNHVTMKTEHVLLVDVNVDIKGLPVVQVCDAYAINVHLKSNDWKAKIT